VYFGLCAQIIKKRRESNMVKKLRVFLAVMLIGCLAVSAGAIGLASSKPVTLKLAYVLTPTSPQTKGVFKFAELAEKYTKGQIKVKVYHSGVLGAERDIMEGMKLGTIDMTNGTAGVLSAFIPKLQVLDMPFLFRDHAHADKVLFGKIGKELLNLLPSSGYVGLSWFEIGFRNVSNSKRAVNSAADMKGLRFRLPEITPYIEYFKVLGATPIAMNMSELFMAFKTGTVDGQDNGPSHTYTQKTYEAQKYYSVLHYAYGAGIIMISQQSWNKLNSAQQESLRKAAVEAAVFEREVLRAEDDVCLRLMEEAGLIINRNPDMTGFLKAAPKVYEIMSKNDWYDAELIQKIKNVK
jgi:tripartite ATP-independent transporter DctP family solute receptor